MKALQEKVVGVVDSAGGPRCDEVYVNENIAMCSRSCGYEAARGKDRKGQPLKTCCRACAQGSGHDSSCSKTLHRAAPTGRPCTTGCGFQASVGFRTCCPKCEKGEGHSDSCPKCEIGIVAPSAGSALAPPPTATTIGATAALFDGTAAATALPCSKSCGFLAAEGSDRKGQPLTTCCRGCASGKDHDRRCAANRAPGVSRSLCVKGCGKPVAFGRDTRGREWTTCCPGCAKGGDHSMNCGLTTREGDALRKERRRRQWRKVKAVFVVVSDPLWGVIEFKHMKDGDGDMSRRQHMAWIGFTFCPCVMVTCGLCSSEIQSGTEGKAVRKAWLRLLLSGSMFFCVLQVLLLALALAVYDGFVPMSENPMLGPPLYIFDDMGAKNAARVKQLDEWWRMFTPILLHGGFIHLLGNLLLQMRTGLVLECVWGTPTWLVVYLGSGFYGNLASCIMEPDILGVGSSGALCGLLGAWLPWLLCTWNQTSPKDEQDRNGSLILVIFMLIVMIPMSFMPMVDYSAHLGGMLAGWFLAMVLFAGRLEDRRWRWCTRIAGIVLTGALYGFSMYIFLSQTETKERLLDVCGHMRKFQPGVKCEEILGSFG